MRRSKMLANMVLVLLVMLVTAACGGSYTGRGTTAPGSSTAPKSESGTEPAQAEPLPPASYQSSLTAGQVDDNALFNDYLGYLQSYQGPYGSEIDVSRRFYVRVVDSDQHPVAGARVRLLDTDQRSFEGRTLSDGRVLFFPNEAGFPKTPTFQVVVDRGQTEAEPLLLTQNDTAQSHDITLPLTDNNGPVGVDLVFLLDATGSMGDELEKIKATVGAIASRIEQLPGSSAPRLGLVAYRDHGDDYVTRRWDFTDNVWQFSANLAQVEAAGGGDTPEAVNEGLSEALNLQGWFDNTSGRHIRMIVLVGDAPPHLDYSDDTEYTELLGQAVEQGIKIFPIGASDLDAQGEYIFRQFAQITQGQFVFLTYANGVSGAPGPSTTNDVANFTVQNLDNLVVNLVAGEVANQTGQISDNSGSNTVLPVTSAAINLVAPKPQLPSKPLFTGNLLFEYVGMVSQVSYMGIVMIGTVLIKTGLYMWLILVLVIVWLARRFGKVIPDVDDASLPVSNMAYLGDPHIPSHEMPTLRIDPLNKWQGAYANVWVTEQPVQSDGQQTVSLKQLPSNHAKVG